MPEKPTFEYRFGPLHAPAAERQACREPNLPKKMVLACLLHSISTMGFIHGEHGYWGAQLVESYLDEEVAWASRAHQVLRFYARGPCWGVPLVDPVESSRLVPCRSRGLA